MTTPATILALVGLRCVGKTSVGRALGELCGLPFVDLDELLVERLRGGGDPGLGSAGEVLATVGETTFRELESELLAEELEDPMPRVLATGGGVVEDAANRELLRARSFCLWLREDLTLLQVRLALDPAPRPALGGVDAVAELHEIARRREPFYAEVAAATLDCARADVPALARRALELWRELEDPGGESAQSPG